MTKQQVKELIKIRLNRIVDAAGLTQKQLADKTGLSQGAISQYLSCDRTPGAIELHFLCAGLEMSADYVLGTRDL